MPAHIRRNPSITRQRRSAPQSLQTDPHPRRRSANVFSHHARFAREWVKSPFRIGAIAPSSRFLAKAICRGVDANTGPIIELGPGTGVFTAEMLRLGAPSKQIAAIETNKEFAENLQARFPGLRVLKEDAENVAAASPFGPNGAALVICGLPLLAMPKEKVRQILGGSFKTLRDGGEMRMFTYGRRFPASDATLSELGLQVERSAFALFNLPPATVYRLTRR